MQQYKAAIPQAPGLSQAEHIGVNKNHPVVKLQFYRICTMRMLAELCYEEPDGVPASRRVEALHERGLRSAQAWPICYRRPLCFVLDMRPNCRCVTIGRRSRCRYTSGPSVWVSTLTVIVSSARHRYRSCQATLESRSWVLRRLTDQPEHSKA